MEDNIQDNQEMGNDRIVSNDLKPDYSYKFITLIERVQNDQHYNMKQWRCRCKCGAEFIRREQAILQTINKKAFASCGCSKKEWDETLLNVPPTRRWQLKNQREGNCVQCGKKRNPLSVAYCSNCLDAHNKLSQEYARDRGLIKGEKRKGGKQKFPR